MRGGHVHRYCPKCRGYFTGQLLCPSCGVQLSASEGLDSDTSSLASKIRRHLPALQASFVRRLLLGLLLAQGLYYGFRELALAGTQVFHDPTMWWGTSRGMLTAEALQFVALLLAAMVAGAAHSRAVSLGIIVGLLNSAAVLAAAYQAGDFPEGLFLYTLPPLHAFAGLLGGLFGRMMWKPVQSLPVIQEAAPSVPAPPPRPVLEPEVTPIRWSRVVAGTVLAFIGTVWAQSARTYIAGFGGGGSFQGQFVTWQISALATLIGAAFAGSTSRSGLRHGLITGSLLASTLAIAQFYLGLAYYPAHEFWIDNFNLGHIPSMWPGMAIGAGSAFLIATLGGWLGAAVFPRTVKNRYRPYMD